METQLKLTVIVDYSHYSGLRTVRAFMACVSNCCNAIDTLGWNHVDNKLIEDPPILHTL